MAIPSTLGIVLHITHVLSLSEALHDFTDIHFSEAAITACLLLDFESYRVEAPAFALAGKVFQPIDGKAIIIQGVLSKCRPVY